MVVSHNLLALADCKCDRLHRPRVGGSNDWLAGQSSSHRHGGGGDGARPDVVLATNRRSTDAGSGEAMTSHLQSIRVSKFQTDLPHALRECGLIAALQGQVQKARRYLDESLAIAERQGARFEHAQSLLARGQVGQQHSWPEAPQDVTSARQALHALGANFSLDSTS